MLAYRSVTLFWKTFGVFPTSFDRHQTPVLFTVFVAASCAYISVYTPWVVCKVGARCTSESVRILKEIYPGTVNVTSTVSRIALLCAVKLKFRKYKETLEACELYTATTDAESAGHKRFAVAVVAVCLTLIVPVNALRIWTLIAGNQVDGSVIALYASIYVQNMAMCCSETQFAAQCFALYCKFRTINDEIAELKAPLTDFSSYLWRSPTPSTNPSDSSTNPADSSSVAVAPVHRRSVTRIVEALRIRHWLVREAVTCLNDLFGIQLGLSVCVLCVMLFLDIYYETFHVMGEFTLSTLTIYGWLLQYLVRYIGIILLAHLTTKQALYTKTIIANMKSNYLDDSIKEELHLFLDQISHSSVEFTACDIFTLNIRLITSTFTTGLTYLVILIQYQSNKNR